MSLGAGAWRRLDTGAILANRAIETFVNADLIITTAFTNDAPVVFAAGLKGVFTSGCATFALVFRPFHACILGGITIMVTILREGARVLLGAKAAIGHGQ